MRNVLSLVLTGLLGWGCAQPPQQRVSFPLVGHGVAAGTFTARGWEVTLTTARLGLGPAYFCVTQADKPDLCETPLVEWAATATVDALSPLDQPLGEITGISGEIRSVQFDYAITWFNTQQEPSATAAAPDGHSAVLAGTARKDGYTIHFNASVDVLPYSQGQRAVLGMPVSATVDAHTTRMVGLVDPTTWFAQVNFDALLAAPGDGGPPPSPQEIFVEIGPGSSAHNALVLQLTVNQRPAFVAEPAP